MQTTCSEIVITSGLLAARISPRLGGRVCSLRFQGREALWTSTNYALTRAVESGGIPLLFPFPGVSVQGRWRWNDRQLAMPEHGFLRALTMQICNIQHDCVELQLQSGAQLLHRHYPFAFLLRVRYRLAACRLSLEFELENQGATPLPYALGIHPYFRMGDAQRAVLKCGADFEQDFVHGSKLAQPADIDLTQPTDRVLYALTNHSFRFSSPADGYAFTCRFDPTFDTLTVYNGQPGSVCIEPWTSLVNTANTGRRLLLLSPGGNAAHTIRFSFETV